MSFWQVYCSFCYETEHVGGQRMMACGKCSKRLYCSAECQLADWKQGHKVYCCKSGEVNFEFEIGETEHCGIGIFALKRISRGQKIFVERIIDKTKDLTPAIRIFALNLQPRHADDINETFSRNEISTSEVLNFVNKDSIHDDIGAEIETDCLDSRYMCMTLARVNHDCIGNSSYHYIKELKAVVWVASRNIEPQQEITFSYVEQIGNPSAICRLQSQWNFECTCRCCTDISVRETMSEITDLVIEMKFLGQNSLVITKGKRILQILEMHQLPYIYFARIYYRMFCCAISRPESFREAVAYITEAVKYSKQYFGDIPLPEIKAYSAYLKNPKSHPNYLTAVKMDA